MEGRTSTKGFPWPSTLSWLRLLLIATLLILAALYVLGILVNLYSSAPYTSTDFAFSLHYSLGIIAVAFGMSVLSVSVLTRRPTAVLTSFVAFIAVAAAGQAGRIFAFSSNNTAYSLVMSVGFLIAFASYFSEVLVVGRMLSSVPAAMQQ